MRTIDRYVLREITITALFAVVVLSGVLVFGNMLKRVFDLILNHEVPLRYIVTFAQTLLPFCLTYTLPWGFVTAVLLVFGRLAADNELDALRMSGVSLRRICAPVLIYAALVSAICFWLNATFVPRAHLNLRKTVVEIAQRHPTALFAANQIIDQFRGHRIYIGGKQGDQLSDIHIFELDELLQPSRVVFAKSGTVSADPAGRKLVLQLTGARIEEWPRPFDPAGVRESFRLDRGATTLAVEQLQARELRSPPLSARTTTRILRYRDRLEDTPGLVLFELHRRFSMSFAALVLTLVSLPLAVSARRGEMAVGFGLSVVVAFSYFLLLGFANSRRFDPASRPELLVWLGNLLFTLPGVIALLRLNRR